MKKNLIYAVILLALMVSACASVTPTPTPQKSGTIRVGYSSDPDMGDVPSLMAADALRGQGYTIERVDFAGADLAAAALAKGDVDIGMGSMRTYWAAVAKGAAIRTVMEQVANVWSLIGRPELKTCSDLDGQRLAFTNNSSFNKAMTDAYLKQSCPTVKPQLVFIANSDARAAALLANQIDATPLELADVIALDREAPGKFHAMVDYGQAMPNLKGTGVQVNQGFAAKNTDLVRDYIRTLLTVHRSIGENPLLLQAAAIKYLKLDPTAAGVIAKAYLAKHIWNENGDLSQDAINYSLDFYKKAGNLPNDLDPAALADLSYLNAVLGEMGTK